MAAAHQTAASTLDQQRLQPVESRPRGAIEPFGGRRGEQLGEFAKGLGILIEDGLDLGEPGLEVDRRRARMHRGRRAGKPIGERVVDALVVRQMIERAVLVEAAHLHRPFDRLAGAVEFQAPVSHARDWQHAAIELRGERPVDLQFRQAGGMAFGQCRIVEEWEPYRALDLERAIPRQEHDRCVGVDAPDLPSAMGRRIGKKGKYGILRNRGIVHLVRNPKAKAIFTAPAGSAWQSKNTSVLTWVKGPAGQCIDKKPGRAETAKP